MSKVSHFLAAAILAVSVAGGAAFAETSPKAGPHDSRVRYARWVDGQVYRLNTALTRVTSVEFGPGETIKSIIAGDTVSFNFDGVPGGSAFVIKPTAAGVSTNITVYTNKRSYYFYAVDSSKAEYFAIRFTYPNSGGGSVPENKTVRRTAPNYDYGADRVNSVTPTQVWDDGAYTYFKFRNVGEMPAIFKVAAGVETSVNSSTMTDGTVRVSGISPFWIVRLGKSETTIGMMKAMRLVQ